MTNRRSLSNAWSAFIASTAELRMFLGYALIVFRPGATPPQHPDVESHGSQRAPGDWDVSAYQAYIDEARRNMDSQQADKRDIRARAQVVLTTALVLGAAIAASYAGKPDLCTAWKLVYLVTAVCTALTALASGGIITAQSPIGAPNLGALLDADNESVHRRLADEYAASRQVGAATVAVLVTVLRDCVLTLVVGAGLLAMAHAFA